ncbi:hypothetical protein [Nocardia sp. NPDC051463]|uniref:hypothetical protein n=1 Tax=Nocardia sp. NPDC051463 TaxID=3154845 RepID=UPI0034489F38
MMRCTRGSSVARRIRLRQRDIDSDDGRSHRVAGRLDVGPIPFGCVLLSLIPRIPLLIDRLPVRRLSPFPATPVFPTARVAVEFLLAAVSPFGTIFGTSAATQSTNPTPLQLVSVAGSNGISSSMGWVAAAIDVAVENRLSWPSIRTITLTCRSAFVLVLIGSGPRLATAPDLVRVAGISASRSRGPHARARQQLKGQKSPGAGSDGSRPWAFPVSARFTEALLSR